MVGLVNEASTLVVPVYDPSGKVVTSIHDLIRSWESISQKLDKDLPSSIWESAQPMSEVKILAPLRGRDVLCVGKNYKDHAVYDFRANDLDQLTPQGIPQFGLRFK